MAVINSIEFLVAEGNESKVHEMMRDPKGLPLTRSQKGCQRVELSVDIEDSNRFFLTEVWDEKNDFDENPRRILKRRLRFRAEPPHWPLHALCVFLCAPLFEPK